MKIFLEKVDDFVIEEYDDGTSILLDSDSGIVHLLNTTANLLYKLCESKVDKEDLFQNFLSKFDFNECEVSLDEVRSDFEHVIKEFSDAGIIVLTS